jgi:hypothetical protein
MTWNWTLFAVHMLAMWGFLSLYRSAPCWMQKGVVALLSAAMGVFAASYLVAIAGEWWSVYLLPVGFALEHTAILLYVFRLKVQGTEWNCSSQRSPSLPG